jgi:asparagine synthase (glutamine-hydrolysing)
VLLTGNGGDEALSFSGRGVVAGLVDQGRWLTAYRELVRWSRLRGRPLASPHAAVAVLRQWLPDVVGRPGSRSDRLSELRINAWQRRFPLVGEALREQHEMIVKRPRSAHDAQLAMLGLGHLAGRCESWAATGAAAGVSYRHPLLDPRLVELALRAPPACFWSGGWTRPAFRLAVEPLLPPAVTWNPSKEEPVLNPVLNEVYGDEPRCTHPRGVQLTAVEAVRAEASRVLLGASR